MKDNLEKAFKNSLQDYEVPYNPKAWENVSSKLRTSSATGGVSAVTKWLVASVLVGAVAAGSYFLWLDYDEEKTPRQEVSNKEEKRANPVVSSESEKDYHIETSLKDEQLKTDKTYTKESAVVDSEIENKVAQNNTSSTKEEVQTPSEDEETKDPIVHRENEQSANQFVIGHVSKSVVCEGESIEIVNPSKYSKVKFEANGNEIVIQPEETYTFTPLSPTKIEFVNEKNEVIETIFIKVQSLPSANFNFEANIFEAGLPVVLCEAYGNYVSYTWNFADKFQVKGPQVKHHFFEKGDYEVSLKVTDRNGCENTVSKTIQIREKYNLMAVDAFKPNGSDLRNRTFMPYSLTERDVKFQLTIVDPVNNDVVFTSSDVNHAWDGTDQNTGRMTPSNKAYIWRVHILSPLPNERPIYAGTIIHD